MARSTDDRQGRILAMVREKSFASIEQLATHFEVTHQTVRRIVNRLCDEGQLRRLHGGVGLPVANQNIAYQSRQTLNLDAKQRIARAVSELIPDGASLMIGLGTTPECVAIALSSRADLRVMTNSLNVASAFAGNPGIEITLVGGTLRARDRDVIGEPAVAFFSRFKADFGIFGVGGIDEDGTLLDFYPGEVEARQAIERNCRTSVLVADASKFGRNATVRGGHLEDCDSFYTDGPIPAAFRPLADRFADKIHPAAPPSGKDLDAGA
jgi:DeoR family glycerol-3-phosphate regulon repressor